MSDYDFVATGSLKLKNPLGISSKNKKKKNKIKVNNAKQQREAIERAIEHSDSSNDKSGVELSSNRKTWMTDAEKKVLAQQEKRQLEKIMAKAKKSHKQRVEEFNSHLENLTEHYDIPKVSWTK